MEAPFKLTYIAAETDEGLTLNHILRQKLCLSGTEIKHLKRSNSIYINGYLSFTSALVHACDHIEVELSERGHSQERIAVQKGPLDILYQDVHLFILNKPAYLPVHPGPGHAQDTLANYVLGYEAEQGRTDSLFRAVNRLDHNTSGAMVVARSAHVHHLFQTHGGKTTMERTYFALVHGETSPTGTIDAPIIKEVGAAIRRVISPLGAPAFTQFERIASENGYSLLKVTPHTGRTHQIRVHLSHIGHPLVGDFLYGREEPELIGRHALHSAAVSLIHPISHSPLSYSAPLPADMRSAILRLLPETAKNL